MDGKEQTRDQKLLLSRREAADRLSMSVDHFERYVQPELALVRTGRKRLVPVAELERWVERNADHALGFRVGR